MSSTKTPAQYFTFGSRYAYEPHPTLPQAHPDGWLEVRGTDYETARKIAVALLGTAWSCQYDEATLVRDCYPDGALYVVTLSDPAATEVSA
ncbi:MAG: hypothetical protein LBU50_03955 [Cellulomonas sp.]|jgi:hypothetical protein|nr:hypothetical protein [Cellulomonas sp.]